MLSDLVRGMLPSSWRRYTVPRGCTVIQWITDFAHRVRQLDHISQLATSRGPSEIKVCRLYKFFKFFFSQFFYNVFSPEMPRCP